MEDQSYEFSPSQNELIRDLSGKMQTVSYILIVVGILSLVGGIVTIARGGISDAIQGIAYGVVGFWTLNAANSFKLIVDTEGQDIENLLGALGELRKLYTFQIVVWMAVIVFIVIAIVTAMALGGATR